MAERLALYPGTFDPVTLGHLDVIERATKLFDRVIVALATNASKQPLFSLEERRELVEANLGRWPSVSVAALEGLTVDFAREMGAVALIRGLRAVSDFEYEFQMAQMNRHLDDSIETIFLMPNQEYFYTSSNLIKQIATITQERLRAFVPPNVLEALTAKHRDFIRAE
ncbi:MAG: pantetheine-phosphate adenylyltransferase [Opitutales bacterium]